MKTNVTRDFEGAKERRMQIFYNDTSGEFEIQSNDETISFYDSSDEANETSDGSAVEKVKKFIAEN